MKKNLLLTFVLFLSILSFGCNDTSLPVSTITQPTPPEQVKEPKKPAVSESEHDHSRTEDLSRGGSGRPLTDEKQVLAFYTEEEGLLPGSYPTLMGQSENIDWVVPFWFRLDPDKGSGHVTIFTDKYDINSVSNHMKQVIEEAHQKGVKVLALVHNLLYGDYDTSKQLAHEMVATPQGRANFIEDLLQILKEYGFDGVNMDVEYVPLEDRDNFSLLMKELYKALKAKGYTVTISVPAKTGDYRTDSWSGPFDYKALGQNADLILLMTYDEHGYSSGPGPIASYNWVEKVLKYAVTQIPSEKIFMGIPSYGFDWTEGQRSPRYLSYAQAMEMAYRGGYEIKWDDKAKVPYFSFWDAKGKKHEVWFESSHSLKEKLKLVDKYGIKGIGIWRLGMEDPTAWEVISEEL